MPLLSELTPHGWLHADELPAWDSAQAHALFEALPEQEQQAAHNFKAKRRLTYAGGRSALRRALEAMGQPATGPILSDHRGAPLLTNGAQVRASISHKNTAACALVAPAEPGRIGVDIEEIGAASEPAARLTLTPKEHEAVFAMSPQARRFELALRFSLKEALYKALDPFVERYVGFKEVEAWPAPQHTAKLILILKNGEGPFEVQALWRTLEPWVITSVRVRTSST